MALKIGISVKKVALLSVEGRSAWMSCNIIKENLVKTYDQLSKSYQIKSIKLQGLHSFDDFLAFRNEISNYGPDILIIIDHGKALVEILRCLVVGLKSGTRSVPLMIHCYGDFPHHSMEWLQLQSQLKNWPMKFTAASPASQRLIAKVLDHASIIEVVPFAIDTSVFSFEKKPASKSTHILKGVYSGRISLQKNIHLMIPLLAEWAEKRQRQVEFSLIGPFDDVGADILGIENTPGLYCHQVLRQIKVCQNTFFSVKLLGPLNHLELSEELRASDLFFSLSLHHDEDFGMAPAEALCMGLPAILSGWGGYHFFSNIAKGGDQDGGVQVIPVSSAEKMISFSKVSTFRALDNVTMSEESQKQRSETFKQALSFLAVAEKIKLILELPFEPFSGFSSKLTEIDFFYRSSYVSKQVLFYDQTYSDLYQSYYEN